MKEENTRLVFGNDGPEESLPVAVIDASFFAAFLLGGNDKKGYFEARSEIEKIVENGGMFFVPALFWFEIGNALLNASKPKKNGLSSRISVSDANDILYDLKQLPIVTKDENDLEILMRIKDLAAQHSLTFYDASYLELAKRLDLRLLTFDADLKRATKKLNRQNN